MVPYSFSLLSFDSRWSYSTLRSNVTLKTYI